MMSGFHISLRWQRVCSDFLENTIIYCFENAYYNPLEKWCFALVRSIGPLPRLTEQDSGARAAAVHGSEATQLGTDAVARTMPGGEASARPADACKDMLMALPPIRGTVRDPPYLEDQSLPPTSQAASTVAKEDTMQGSQVQIGNIQYTAFSNPVREDET